MQLQKWLRVQCTMYNSMILFSECNLSNSKVLVISNSYGATDMTQKQRLRHWHSDIIRHNNKDLESKSKFRLSDIHSDIMPSKTGCDYSGSILGIGQGGWLEESSWIRLRWWNHQPWEMPQRCKSGGPQCSHCFDRASLHLSVALASKRCWDSQEPCKTTPGSLTLTGGFLFPFTTHYWLTISEAISCAVVRKCVNQ